MGSCCEEKCSSIDPKKSDQLRTLKIVFFINAVMFVVEIVQGLLAHSSALMADSLDMFGDAVVYAISIIAINRSDRWRSGAALVKGVIMALFGLGVLFEVVRKMMISVVPHAETMGWIGGLAMLANLICLFLLMKHRNQDINMRSVWICSRNDIISNSSVLIAAYLVTLTNQKWPDIAVGMIIAMLFLWSSGSVIRPALNQWRSPAPNA